MPDSPIAVVGEGDVVEGFKALGFSVYPAKDGAGCAEILEGILKRKAAVCLVQDTFYKAASDVIAGSRRLPNPVFIPFSKSGRMELLDELVKSIRLRATGAL